MRIRNNNNKYIFNEVSDTMIGFLIGVLVGGFFGIVVMGLLAAASRADEHTEQEMRRINDNVIRQNSL